MRVKKKKMICETCPLYESKLNGGFIAGSGNLKTAKFMIVGESPGEEEFKEGIPFVGRSGYIINNLLQEAGVNRSDCYVTNVVKCFPGHGKKTPSGAILKCTEAYLEKEIIRYKGEKIVTLGVMAAHGFLRRARRIIELIGHPYRITNKLVLSVWHPAAFLYKHDSQILEDIKRAFKWLII